MSVGGGGGGGNVGGGGCLVLTNDDLTDLTCLDLLLPRARR